MRSLVRPAFIPDVADAATDDDVAEIRRIVTTNPRIVAVGETGLDYDRTVLLKKRKNQ